MVFNMFHGTLQPLAGASRTLSQLAEDGLLPRLLERRMTRTDAPWVATVLTAAMAIAFLLAGDPTWMVAAANLTYLIGISLPNIAVWLLRRNEPDLPRPYRASTTSIRLGVLAAGVWMVATVLGFEQYGLPTVLFGVSLAYSGSLLYAWRVLDDRRRRAGAAADPLDAREAHRRDAGGAASSTAPATCSRSTTCPSTTRRMVTALQDLFVAVALLTISVGLILPGMIAHASAQVMQAADRLATGTVHELTSGLMALSRGRSRRRPRPGRRAEGGRAHPRRDRRHGQQLQRDDQRDRAGRGRLSTSPASSCARTPSGSRSRWPGARPRSGSSTTSCSSPRPSVGRLLDEAVGTLETQRRTIAADLHDGPIQRLTTIGLLLDRAVIATHRGDRSNAGARLDAAKTELQTEIAALRRMMAGLRPPVLDEGGLAVAIADHVRGVCAMLGVTPYLDLHDVDLDTTTETTLYRVAQESLSNVTRHSGATVVEVVLHEGDEDVELTIRDNGIGMRGADLRELVNEGHYGLAGMRERVEMIGGRLTVTSPQGGGTTLHVVVAARRRVVLNGGSAVPEVEAAPA